MVACGGTMMTAWHSRVMRWWWCNGSGERDATQSYSSHPVRAGGQGIEPTEHGGAQRGIVRACSCNRCLGVTSAMRSLHGGVRMLGEHAL